LGRIAALASEEIRYPEISRILAARGAEVILHPTSEASSTLMNYKNVAKIARAQENQCYIVSANTAAITGTGLAAYSTDARSQIVDDRGLILCEIPGGESITACADIDIAALRYRRNRVGMDNMLARQPMELYARALAKLDMHPSGTLGDGSDLPAKDFYKTRQGEVIAKLSTAGII
jgi:predicted amidohydrolase